MYVSNANTNRSFASTIRSNLSGRPFHLTESAWIRFLQDHLVLLRQHSTVVQLTEATMNRYQYCINSFLEEDQNQVVGTDQAFRVVNKLHSEMEFTLDLGEVYIPDAAYVRELRNKYTTVKAQQNRIS